jgi:hypothetical protein
MENPTLSSNNANLGAAPASPPAQFPFGTPVQEKLEDDYNLDHETPHNRFYLIKHILTLMAGFASANLTITGVGFLADYIFKNADTAVNWWLYFKGFAYTSIIASLLVFGAVHVILYLCERDKAALPSDKSLRVGKTLTTIFAVCMLATSLSFVISFIYPLLGSALGIIDIKDNEIAKSLLISAVGIIIPFFFAAYHIAAFAKIKKLVFAISTFAIVLILSLLIAVVPSGEVRDAVQDQKKIDDLEIIENAIAKYVKESGSLPTDLKQLAVKDLKNNLSVYSFSVSSRAKYKLCADFNLDTMEELRGGSSDESMSSYSFNYHRSGNYCFTRGIGYSNY